jgi:biotin carboxyl carrier protein
MARELIATVGKDERNLVVERREDGRFSVTIDGEERVVDSAQVGDGTWSLIIDGRSFVVHLDPAKRHDKLTCDGVYAEVDVEDARRKRLAEKVGRTAAADVRGELVKAPIAGKVVKIVVALGDEVEPGAGVCVLEAMKMENEILAERGGTVKAIHVASGDPVDNGDKLVTLE